MKEIRSKSYTEKKASFGDAVSRGLDVFSRMTGHPLWHSFWKGTPLDSKSGLLGQGIKSLERAGAIDKDKMEFASVTRDMVALVDRIEPDCDKIPQHLIDILEDMHSSGNSLLLNYSNKTRSWRKWCEDNFDYSFGPFARAYNSYITKNTNEIGEFDKKAREFADSQMSLLFESFYKLKNKLIAANGTTPGGSICP